MSPPVNYVTLIITNITTLVTVDSQGDHFANYCPQITSSLDTRTPQLNNRFLQRQKQKLY